MVELVRRRQTKGAETDMLGLKPPRHIPTLPLMVESASPASRPLSRTAALAGTGRNGRILAISVARRYGGRGDELSGRKPSRLLIPIDVAHDNGMMSPAVTE